MSKAHHCIFCVFICILSLLSVVNCLNIRNLRTYENRYYTSPMQRVVVHDSTKDVYVGARNAIYHFTYYFEVKRVLSTGPKIDHLECILPLYPCIHNRTITDNDNKVLEIFEGFGSPLLLTCGTLYQGLCQLQPLNDIMKRTWVQPFNDTVGFISGRDSTVAFFAPGYNNKISLYSASTYDGRPLIYSPPSVSSRIIVREGDGIKFQYSDETGTSFTGVDFKMKEIYKVEYITGFSYGDFAYFLTTQKESVESESIETRLARVCTNDSAFFSYTEIPLKCNFALDAYNLATAAHLGVASAETKDKLSDVLYISFVRTVPGHGRLVDKSKGSVICSFPMSTVIESFTNATRECFKAEPKASLLKHVTGGSLNCTKQDNEEIYGSFCGSEFNHYIGGLEPILGEYRNHLDAHITSLATTLQNGKWVAIAGTEIGDIIKVYMGQKEHILYTINIAEDQKDKSIQRSNAFYPSHEFIYFLVGNKVVRFPIGSCSPYTKCHDCLTVGDPLMCGWCNNDGGYCGHQNECGAKYFSKNTCPPIIFKVMPRAGPTAGGTNVTIIGDNFGIPHEGENKMHLSVEIMGIPCDITSWHREKIDCTTRPGRESKSHVPIVVKVSDFTLNSFNYTMNGTAFHDSAFEYLTPILYGIYPGKGPVSGGTNITLYGKFLFIGSTISIKVADIPCKKTGIHTHTLKRAWCITGELSSNATTHINGSYVSPVKMYIDDAIIEVENQLPAESEFDPPLHKNFVYLPDPEIYSIDTKATTVSGLKNIIIKGKYLNNVENPRMLVNYHSAIPGETVHLISDPCWFNSTAADGSIMICPAPRLQNSSFHPLTEETPLDTYLAFLMDGVEKLRLLPKYEWELSKLLYYPDPEFEMLSEEGESKKINYDESHLQIQGKYLNLALDKSDVRILFDNATECAVTEMTLESILCAVPSLEEFENRNSTRHTVTVHIGTLKIPLGIVKFTKETSNKLQRVFGIIGTVLLIIVLGSLTHFVCRWYFRNKKKYSDYRSTFTWNPDQGTCEGGVAIQPRNRNDYQGLRRNEQNSVTGEAAVIATQGESCERSAHFTPIDEETMRLLESQNILVLRNCLTLGDIIGEGHFGCVYKGKLVLPDEESQSEVAVKTLHNSWSNLEQDTKAFLQEGLRMKDFHHHNVLTLIGVCFHRDGSPMVIIPFMKHGDLLSFIRNENNAPTVKDLMMFGVQIASGMKYLSEIKFVHRDLAARNCMLDDDKTVKVADFGLSRDVYESAYYSSDDKKAKLPIKWMAPESIEKGSYTTKSDVWSYGVVLWELMTRGIVPYPGVDNWDVLHYLKLRKRLPQPSYCPDSFFAIMLACWDEDPNKRPTFAELEEQVQSVITKLEHKSRLKTVGLDVTYVNYPQTLVQESAAAAAAETS